MDELSCTMGNEEEALEAASGGTAERGVGGEEVWLPAHSSWFPQQKKKSTPSSTLRSYSVPQGAFCGVPLHCKRSKCVNNIRMEYT